MDSLDPPGGFIFQPLSQQPPAACHDFPVQSRLLPHVAARVLWSSSGRAGQVADSQILDTDQVEPSGQFGGDLLAPVLARVGLASLEFGNGQLCLGTAPGTGLTTGEFPLQQHYPPPLLRPEPGHGQKLAGGQRSTDSHAAVDSDDAAISRRRDGHGLHRERDMPAIGWIPRDPVGLHTRRDRPGPAKADPACLWHPDRAHLAAQPPNVAGLDRHDAESLVPAGLAPRWAAVRSIEIALPGLREVAQSLLLNHLAAGAQPTVLRACLRKLATLLQIPGSAGAAGTPPRVLLYRQIPYEPGVRTVFTQDQLLRRRRVEPVTRHKANVLATTDISEGVKRRFAPALQS